MLRRIRATTKAAGTKVLCVGSALTLGATAFLGANAPAAFAEGAGITLPASTNAACSAARAKYPSVTHKTISVGITAGAGETVLSGNSPYGYTGLIPTFVEQILKCLDDQPKFTPFNFDGLIPALTAKHVQMVAGGMYDTPEREKQVAFIDYVAVTEGGIVAKGNPKHIRGEGAPLTGAVRWPSVDSLCGLSVVESAGTEEVTYMQEQSAKCVKEGKAPIKLQVYADGNQVNEALVDGRADFELNAATVAVTMAKQYPGKVQGALKPWVGPIEGLEFQLGETTLLHAVAAAIKPIQKAGLEKEGLVKYLGKVGSEQIPPKVKI